MTSSIEAQNEVRDHVQSGTKQHASAESARALIFRLFHPAGFPFWIVLVSVSLLLSGCGSDSDLKNFSSDGCSLFPDSSLINADDWCSCCFEHDTAYWRGGTAPERELADEKLRDCVAEKTQNEALATLMYEGVRFGGSPYFYNWYRWGYGWSYDRKYQALNQTESKLADQLLAKYVAHEQTAVCEP